MTYLGWLLAFGCIATVFAWQMLRVLGVGKGLLLGLGIPALLAVAWLSLLGINRPQADAPLDLSQVPYVTSNACFKCHADHYDSWHRSYHRTMTQEATPATVQGDFDNCAYTVQRVRSRMTREGDRFFMETADPKWVADRVATGKPVDAWGPAQLKKFEVARLVGSHWFQECMYRDEVGRYWRLPLSYHIVEQRWIHTNGAFLAPDTDHFWDKSTVWNESCLYCHNTKPSKQPRGKVVVNGQQTPAGYETSVAELGIACEACHGPGEEHIRVNQNLARRLAFQEHDWPDPTIINPQRLTAERSAEICGHCHGATVPRAEAWNAAHTDPYTPGDDLSRAFFLFWSEAEQARLYQTQRKEQPIPPPEPNDGRFWGDGTPLTTALEFQGMALSPCYLQGQGQLSCLSCHSLHAGDPNHQITARMRSNEACLQCHTDYRDRVAEHTHHPADSPGSLCYNCHMPYQVYSLLTTHRSHRIQVPRIKDSLGTGKPHACNLCHLDQSLAWTQQHLRAWYGHAPEPLGDADQRYASSLVELCQADARTRAVFAGAFSWPAAQQASGTDWSWPLLLFVLEHDRYPAVRYLAHRGLRSVHGGKAQDYDYLEMPRVRQAQLGVLQRLLRTDARPSAISRTSLPVGKDGGLDPAVLAELLRARKDPDVSIHE
jgi:predicted CXXCH cytochrome family protein